MTTSRPAGNQQATEKPLRRRASNARRRIASIAGAFVLIAGVIGAIVTIHYDPSVSIDQVSNTKQLSGSDSQPLSISCGAGRHVLNGGYQITATKANVALPTPDGSYPIDAQTWVVRASNPDNADLTLTGYALCLPDDGPAVTTVSSETGTPTCPTGTLAIGGGYNATTDIFSTISTTAPAGLGDGSATLGPGWTISAPRGVGAGLTTYALCVSQSLAVTLATEVLVPIPSGKAGTTTLTCDANKQPISLSYVMAGSGDLRNVDVNGNYPVNDEKNWNFVYANQDTDSLDVAAQLVCLKITHTLTLFGWRVPVTLP